MKERFKIDQNKYGLDYKPFALFFRKEERGFFWIKRETWEQIESYKTKEEARAVYETIKDLPEYLP